MCFSKPETWKRWLDDLTNYLSLEQQKSFKGFRAIWLITEPCSVKPKPHIDKQQGRQSIEGGVYTAYR